jgi:hypothetical protein
MSHLRKCKQLLGPSLLLRSAINSEMEAELIIRSNSSNLSMQPVPTASYSGSGSRTEKTHPGLLQLTADSRIMMISAYDNGNSKIRAWHRLDAPRSSQRLTRINYSAGNRGHRATTRSRQASTNMHPNASSVSSQ